MTRLIDADALIEELKKTYKYFDLKFYIEDAPTIEPSKSTEQNVADVPSGDLISREELLKKLDRQIEWEEANAIPYEDADGGCILGLKKARKYVKLASSTEKPNANDCDLISRVDAIEAIQNVYCKPCKERGDDYNEVRCRACEYDNAIIQIDALPSADAVEVKPNQLPPKVPTEWINEGIVLVPQHDWIEMQKKLEEDISADRPKGEWVDKGEYAECSICGAHSGKQFDGVEPIPLKTPYCPSCGADMRGEK